MNEEVLQFLENYLKKNDNKFVGNGREGECSKYLIVSSDGITPIDFTRLCKIFARHSKLFEITFDSMYNNEMNKQYIFIIREFQLWKTVSVRVHK